MKQIPLERFPSGDSQDLAVIALDVEQMHERWGLDFQYGVDDLDEYHAAAIDSPYGPIWLWHYHRMPGGGATVIADSAADAASVMSYAREQLRLSDDDLSWTSPKLHGIDLALAGGFDATIVGELSFSPQQIQDRWGIVFSPARDDRGTLRLAALQTPAGIAHLHARPDMDVSDTQVLVDDVDTSDAVLQQVQEILGLEPQEIRKRT